MRDNSRSVPWYHSLRFRLVAAAITIELVMLSVLLANSFNLLDEAVKSQTQARLEALSPCSTRPLPDGSFSAIIAKSRPSSTG